MLGAMKMLGRMLVLGRIAATNIAALQAQPQMHPCIALFHALFTNMYVSMRDLDLFYV